MKHSGEVVARKGGLVVVDCKSCGYMHLDPLPEVGVVEELYEGDGFYRDIAPGGWFEKEWVEYNEGLWDSFFDFHLGLLGKDCDIVDIGAGEGLFVYHGKKRERIGRIYGIEPSLLARHYSPVILHPRWESICDFSFVDFWNIALRACLVLEHLLDVRGFLLDCRDRLQVGGKLLVQVPNEFNRLQTKVCDLDDDAWFLSPAHINYFTPDGLSGVLHSCGFRVIDEGTTFPMELFLVAGLDYRKDSELGGKLHRIRLRLEKIAGPQVYRFYQSLYRHWGWGREVWMLAEKT